MASREQREAAIQEACRLVDTGVVVRAGAPSRDAIEAGRRLRVDRALLRRDIKRGAIRLGDVLITPPQCIRSLLLFEVARMAPRLGYTRLRQINSDAMKEGVNLALKVEDASFQTRLWLAGRVS